MRNTSNNCPKHWPQVRYAYQFWKFGATDMYHRYKGYGSHFRSFNVSTVILGFVQRWRHQCWAQPTYVSNLVGCYWLWCASDFIYSPCKSSVLLHRHDQVKGQTAVNSEISYASFSAGYIHGKKRRRAVLLNSDIELHNVLFYNENSFHIFLETSVVHPMLDYCSTNFLAVFSTSHLTTIAMLF